MMKMNEILATFLPVVQIVLGKGSVRGCRSTAAQSSKPQTSTLASLSDFSMENAKNS
jgi:hypothetical protein